MGNAFGWICRCWWWKWWSEKRNFFYIFKEFAAKPINHKSLHSVETLHALHVIGFPRFHLRVLFLRRNCLLHLSTWRIIIGSSSSSLVHHHHHHHHVNHHLWQNRWLICLLDLRPSCSSYSYYHWIWKSEKNGDDEEANPEKPCQKVGLAQLGACALPTATLTQKQPIFSPGICFGSQQLTKQIFLILHLVFW